LYEEMRGAGQGSGLVLVLPALWCVGLYLPGVAAIVISLMKAFSNAKPPTNVASRSFDTIPLLGLCTACTRSGCAVKSDVKWQAPKDTYAN
jgi:hypothetical protein